MPTASVAPPVVSRVDSFCRASGSSSGSLRRWSRSALISLPRWPRSSRADVARPVACATGLTPRGSRSSRGGQLGSGRWSPLVQLERHWSLSALVQLGPRHCVHLLHDPRCVHLLHDSVPWWLVRRSRAALVRSPGPFALTAFRHSSSAPLSPPRARTPLEFGRSRQFHTCGHLVLTVPRAR